MNNDDFLITMEDDEPVVTFDDVVGWIRNGLAFVGFVALLVVIAFSAGYSK